MHGLNAVAALLAAQAGGALLDEKLPDWRGQIALHMAQVRPALARLNMASCDACLLGWAMGDFHPRGIGVDGRHEEVRYGFEIPVAVYDEDYERRDGETWQAAWADLERAWAIVADLPETVPLEHVGG